MRDPVTRWLCEGCRRKTDHVVRREGVATITVCKRCGLEVLRTSDAK